MAQGHGVGTWGAAVLDHARDKAIPSQTGRGHIEVSFDSPRVRKMVFLLMPWKLGLDHMLMMMFKMLTSMRLGCLHRSTMTNTLAWKLTLSKLPQYGKPRLTLPGD